MAKPNDFQMLVPENGSQGFTGATRITSMWS
jgi:hypothetical protein